MAIANLIVRISADTAAFEKNIASVERSLNKTGKKWEAIGTKMMKGFTLPIIAGVGVAVKAATDFESSFAGIIKTVDDATDSMGNLTPVGRELAQGMRDLAKTIPVNVNELNRIGEAAGQLGIRSSNILEFTDVMARLGVTTNLSSDQAATSLARFANIMDRTKVAAGTFEFDRLGATIVDLGNNFATTEAEIVEFGTRIAGAGRIAGLTEAQVLGIGTAMSSVGVQAEAGGTAVQKVLNKMTESVATGNAQLAIFAATAGMSAQEFADAFQKDAGEAFARFVQGLGKQGDAAFGTLNGLKLGNERVIRAFLSLANAGDLVTETLRTGQQAWKENTALTKESEQRFKTTASQLTILKNNLQDVAITFGSAFLPVINDGVKSALPLVRIIADLAKGFSELPAPIRNVSFAFVGLVAAIGPVAFAVSKVQLAWAGLLGILRAVVSAISVASVALLTWGGRIAVVARGLPLLGTALAGLGIAVGGLSAPLIAVTALLGGLVLAFPKAVDGINNLSRAISEGRFWQFVTTKDAPGIWEREFWSIGRGAKQAAQGVSEASDSLKTLKDDISGARVANDVDDLRRAFADLTPEMRQSEDVMFRVGQQASLLRQQGGRLHPELTALADAFEQASQAANDWKPLDIPKVNEATERLKGLKKQIQELDETIRNRADLSPSRLLARFGSDAQRIIQDVLDKGQSLNILTTRIRDLAAQQDALDFKKLRESFPDVISGLDSLASGLKTVGEGAPEMVRGWAESLERMRLTTLRGTALRIAEIDRAEKAELDSYKHLVTAGDRFAQQRLQADRAYYQRLRNIANGTFDTLEERMAEQGIHTRAVLEQMADDAKRNYDQMLASGLFTIGELEAAWNRWLELHGKLAPKLKETFSQQMFGDIKGLGAAIGDSLLRAIQGGGNAFAAAAGALGQHFTTKFANYLTAAKDVGGRAIGGFLGGAISSVLPGLGALLGPLVNTITGVFSKLFDRNKGRDMVKAFAEGFGGLDALRAKLDELGAEGERLWKNLTQGVGRNNTAQAATAIKEVEDALAAFGTEAERAQRRMDGLNTALAGVNAKADLFIAPFRALADARKEAGADLDAIAAKMAETAQRGQAEFERLGIFVGATFAGLVRETGDALGALKKLEPSIKVLQQGIREFGLTSTGTIDSLLSMFDLVNDAVTGPILSSIQATGQIFTGLQQAGYMTADLFQTVGDDIGASFRELEAKGGDVAKAMALSQPVLQALWLAQQRYGKVTDETTQSILDQAHQQGLVGDHMKDVNEKILDVLIAIADVFGATLPESFRKASLSAKQAASDIGRELKGISVPPIRIDIEYYDPGFVVPGGGRLDIPAFGRGGVVRQPTLALIGERGPEAVVPLDRYDRTTGGGAEATFGPGPVNLTVVIPPEGIRRAMRDGTPIVVEAVADNEGGSKSALLRALGVS